MTGRIIIELGTGDPEITFEGEVDPGNITSLLYHIRSQYDIKYILKHREEELKNEETRKKEALEKHIKAQKLAEENAEKIAEENKLKEEQKQKELELKQERIILENRKIEAQRIINKANDKVVDEELLKNAVKTLEEIEAKEKELANDNREQDDDGTSNGDVEQPRDAEDGSDESTITGDDTTTSTEDEEDSGEDRTPEA